MKSEFLHEGTSVFNINNINKTNPTEAKQLRHSGKQIHYGEFRHGHWAVFTPSMLCSYLSVKLHKQ